MPAIINSDDGVASGSSGLKTSGGNDGILALQNNGTTNVTVTAAGNVGIGTTSPASKFAVVNSGAGFEVNPDGTAGGPALIAYNRSTSAYLQMTGNALQYVWQISGTAQAAITAAGLFQFNSGYGSVATAYGCRAWVNFNGSGVVAIRTSGNVTSITDNGTGDYTVNFTTAMPDTNYAASLGGGSDTATRGSIIMESQIATTSTMRFQVCNAAAAAIDRPVISITIFR